MSGVPRDRSSVRLGVLFACACAFASGCASVSNGRDDPRDDTVVRRGPIAARSNGPLAQTFLNLRPRVAATTPTGALDLQVLTSYSSIFEVGNSALGDVSFDGELWRTSTMLRTGLGPRTDIEIEIPVVYATSGFLDVFIESWHAVFGLPDSGREMRPQFDYDMSVTVGADEVYSMTGNRVGIGDVPIVLTQLLVDADGAAPAVFVQAAAEIPTGSEDDGFGNGEIDWGLGFGLESNVGDWSFGAGASWVDRTASADFQEADVEVDDGIAAHGDGEWRWTPESSLLVGLRYENAVSQALGIEELGGDVLDLDLGVAIDSGESSLWTFGFSEDLISASGPDFTIMLGFQTRF